MSLMPEDPFVDLAHTCTAPAMSTETIAEIMRERLRRVDQCTVCALGAMEARQS